MRDPTWSDTIARIVRKTGVPVVPMYFEGRNGPLFQLMGLLHPMLRTAMLPRELLKRNGTTIQIRTSSIIPFEKLGSYQYDWDMVAYMRLRTYLLGKETESVSKLPLYKKAPANGAKKIEFEPIIRPLPRHLLTEEVARIPDQQILVEKDDYRVYMASAKEIPNLLLEIGRLREETFRAVHEGTGRHMDLDRFDHHYLHLFLWNREKHEIVGAYRLAQADEVFRQFGIKGLYTSTLFDYKARLLDQINPAIELGRSFVRIEYQKHYFPLLMLWQGICKFVAANPHYRTLFGPVSINNQYDSVSKQLIVTYLKANNFMPDLAKLVKAKNPHRARPLKAWDPVSTSKVVTNIDEVSNLVAEIEAGQRRVPVLLRQYLKLGGKLLGFNIDPEFGDVLDGLILVDLLNTPRKLLRRFMGEEDLNTFLTYNSSSSEASLRRRSST